MLTGRESCAPNVCWKWNWLEKLGVVSRLPGTVLSGFQGKAPETQSCGATIRAEEASREPNLAPTCMQPSGIWGQTPALHLSAPGTRRSPPTVFWTTYCEYGESAEFGKNTANTANKQNSGHGHRSGRAGSSIRSNPACNTHTNSPDPLWRHAGGGVVVRCPSAATRLCRARVSLDPH